MKKLFIVALVLTTLTTSAFSLDPVVNNRAVLNAFNKSFSKAKDVDWTITKGLYRVTFTVDEQRMFAYFKENGDLIATTRYIKIEQLPIALATELKTKYKEYFYMAELFEVLSNGESKYYAVVRNTDYSVTLQGTSFSSWEVFKKVKLH